jgi:hypothetical protein
LVYFFHNLAFRCSSETTSHNLPVLLSLTNEDPRLIESVRAVVKTIAAKNIPKSPEIDIIFEKVEFKQVWDLKILLMRRKKLGDKQFMLRGFERTMEIVQNDLPKAKLYNREKVRVNFSDQGLHRSNISYKDVVTTPCGPAIVIGFQHQSLLIIPIGEYGAIYLEGIPPKDFYDCGIRTIGKI